MLVKDWFADSAPYRKKMRIRILLSLVCLPFLIQAIAFLLILFHLLPAKNDITYPEAAGVYAFLSALKTGHLYSEPLRWPFNEQMYGPVFYILGALCARIANGDDDLTTILVRSLSLLAFVASAGIISFLAWRLEKRREWAAITLVMALACFWAVPYAVSARADLVSIVLALAGLAVYLQARERLSWVLGSGVLLALAMLTKQSVAPILVALLLDTVLAKKFRALVALFAGAAGCALIMLLVLQFRGEPFLSNFTAVGKAIYIWRTALPKALDLLRNDKLSLIACFLAVVGAFANWTDRRYRSILLVAVLGCAGNVAALANSGGDTNYFILPWLLILLLVPAGLTWLERRTQASSLVAAGLILIGVVFLINDRHILTHKRPLQLEASSLKDFRILTDLPYLEARSRQPELLDPYFYHQLSLQGLWSSEPIVRRIKDHAYDAVLLEGSDRPNDSNFLVHDFRGFADWDPEVIDQLNHNYRATCEVGGYLALVPVSVSVNTQKEPMSTIFGTPCISSTRTPKLGKGIR